MFAPTAAAAVAAAAAAAVVVVVSVVAVLCSTVFVDAVLLGTVDDGVAC